jgi:hypothetical protein
VFLDSLNFFFIFKERFDLEKVTENFYKIKVVFE